MIGQKEATSRRASRLLRATFAPLRVRDFRLLFGGQMISTLGEMFYAVALRLSDALQWQELGSVLFIYGVPRVGHSFHRIFGTYIAHP